MLKYILNFINNILICTKSICQYRLNIIYNKIKKYNAPLTCIICLGDICSDTDFSYVSNSTDGRLCRHLNSKYFHEYCLNKMILSQSNESVDIMNTKILKVYSNFCCPLCRRRMSIGYMR